MMPIEEDAEALTILSKLDSTRDLAGSFYALNDWKEKYKELRKALSTKIEVDWRDNGNSFNSCFQYEGWAPEGRLHMRVKFYFKTLALM